MLSDLLKTQTPKEELAIALKVAREFKDGETMLEWAGFSFQDWFVFEMYQNILEHLVEGTELSDDIKENIKHAN